MDAALEVATEFNRALLDQCPHLAVHAAVLAAAGGVIALPGESCAGKSTLAAACTVQGFGYLSDEALVLTSEGTVVPYPRPIALSSWSRTAVGVPAGMGASEGHLEREGSSTRWT